MSDLANSLAARIDPMGSDTIADDEERSLHLRQQQLQTLCSYAIRLPFAVAFAVVLIASTVWKEDIKLRVLAWAVALLLISFTRGIYSYQITRNPPQNVSRELDIQVVFMLVGGTVMGMAAPLFFPLASYEQQAYLTMILVCWTAAGVAAMAAYARVFYAYVTPVLLQLAVVWALTGTRENLIVGILIPFVGLIQMYFARNSERVLRDSFHIRYENERLITELDRERQAVALARDKAEQASRAKSRFLAAASHDLRQPLHALSLYSAALTVRAPDGDVGEIGSNISQAALSLSALVDSLLDISKLDAGAIKPRKQIINVRRLIDHIEADFRPVALKARLKFRVASVDASVETDPILLERILRNLVDNAIKYTTEGGVTLSAVLHDRTVCIAVRDTGPGIPPEERDRIFEEFYQIGNPERDRGQGLGLGLAIVRRLAILLGVEIELEGRSGGSTFTVSMPRILDAGGASYRHADTATSLPSALVDVSVLVIDDEPSIRVGMRTLLEAWGCRVAVASSLTEAERLHEEHQLTIDIIVADFRLRQHESGIDVIRKLHERLGSVPALLISGDTAPERLREAHASGLPLLHKPVSAEKLQEAMLNALNR